MPQKFASDFLAIIKAVIIHCDFSQEWLEIMALSLSFDAFQNLAKKDVIIKRMPENIFKCYSTQTANFQLSSKDKIQSLPRTFFYQVLLHSASRSQTFRQAIGSVIPDTNCPLRTLGISPCSSDKNCQKLSKGTWQGSASQRIECSALEAEFLGSNPGYGKVFFSVGLFLSL